MNKLVENVNGIPMTDSRILANEFGQNHKHTYELIKNHIDALEMFGVVLFETDKGDIGRPTNIALLTEEQALMLLTYTRSREKTDRLRHKLISEFSAMKKYIQKQETVRLAGIQTRRTLTDAIKESDENDRMHGHAYSTYTRMAYKLTGLTALKKEWGNAPGFRESLSFEDLNRVEAVEAMSKTMVELGKQYDEIKNTLSPIFSMTKEIK